MPRSGTVVVRLVGPPESEDEYVILRSPGSHEEIVHLHDYERFYAEPGLYEDVVQELLRCRSPQVAAEALAYALARLGIDPIDVVLLDLGAGTGIVGELATAGGVPRVIGLDALKSARTACTRDRPGVYCDYLVGDLAAPPSELLTSLRRHRPTALISAGAMGGTHAPPAVLATTVNLLPAGAPVVFTIDARWMKTDAPGGYGTVVNQLIESGELLLLDCTRFQHRLSTAGSPIHYKLVVAATGNNEPRGRSTSL
jgi:precorrin-6B methylase 2